MEVKYCESCSKKVTEDDTGAILTNDKRVFCGKCAAPFSDNKGHQKRFVPLFRQPDPTRRARAIDAVRSSNSRVFQGLAIFAGCAFLGAVILWSNGGKQPQPIENHPQADSGTVETPAITAPRSDIKEAAKTQAAVPVPHTDVNDLPTAQAPATPEEAQKIADQEISNIRNNRAARRLAELKNSFAQHPSNLWDYRDRLTEFLLANRSTPAGAEAATILAALKVPEDAAKPQAAIDFEKSPISKERMVLWLRADAGVTKDPVDHVSRWADQSDRHSDLSNSDPARQPQLIDHSVQGRPAIRFDGARTYLSNDTTGIFKVANTMFLVLKTVRPPKDFRIILDTATDDKTSRHQVDIGPNSIYTTVETGGRMDAKQVADGQYFLFTAIFNDAESELFIDGVLSTKGKFQGTRPADPPFVLGSRYTKNMYFFAGDIAELAIYDGVLDDVSCRNIESYLKAKYFDGSK